MSNDKIKTSKWYFSTPDAIYDVEGIDIYDQTIYILLCSHADREGKSFPKYATLARRARMSERKAKDCVANLVKIGLLHKEARKRPDGGDTTNLYTIVDAYDFLQDQEGGAQHASGGMHSMHGGGAQHAPKHNHLSLPSLNKTDCMSASEKTDKINEIKKKPIQPDQNQVEDEIMIALNKYVPGYCYANNLPLGQDHIDQIYLMLLKQFQYRLSADIVRTAAELYFENACIVLPDGSVANKFVVNRPVGLFKTYYEEAIALYKARKHKPNKSVS